MFKLLAFLLILVILFGVEATRALVFGAFGFLFWALIILVAIGLFIPSPMQKFEREKRQKEYEAKQKAERQRQEAYANARRQASIAKQKAWRKKHPRISDALDFMSEHPIGISIAFAVLVIIVIGVVIYITSAPTK